MITLTIISLLIAAISIEYINCFTVTNGIVKRINKYTIPIPIHILSTSLSSSSPSTSSLSSTSVGITGAEDAKKPLDLTGYKLDIRFDGFGVTNMTAILSLEKDFKVLYSGGIDSYKPGFWRIIGYEDGRDVLECTHPILPEYMFFFDIDEPTILWKGQVDMNNMNIMNGEVTSNKKRFGIFPYIEQHAKFTANIIKPGATVPNEVKIPALKDIFTTQPDDFTSPYDMKKYPSIFNEEFVDWWFKNEDVQSESAGASSDSADLISRPKPFFLPNADNEDNSGENSNSDNKKDKKTGFSSSKK